MPRKTHDTPKLNYPGRDREADLLRLLDKFVETLEWEDCEYGAWTNNGKRPFGNSSTSDIHSDICEIIGLDLSRNRCPHCQEIIAEPGAVDPGEYARSLYLEIGDGMRRNWKRLRGAPGTP
jgi:hypothetical protein